MAGNLTRRSYDNCAFQQSSKQLTDPLVLTMDINKYINCNSMFDRSGIPVQTLNAQQIADVESALWGLDKSYTKCDGDKYPFCSASGCLLTNDQRVQFNPPYVLERGKTGDNAVVTTNMRLPSTNGLTNPPSNVCGRSNGPTQPLIPPVRNQNTNSNAPNQSLMSSIKSSINNLFNANNTNNANNANGHNGLLRNIRNQAQYR
jgi:hypothetical protein